MAKNDEEFRRIFYKALFDGGFTGIDEPSVGRKRELKSILRTCSSVASIRLSDRKATIVFYIPEGRRRILGVAYGGIKSLEKLRQGADDQFASIGWVKTEERQHISDEDIQPTLYDILEQAEMPFAVLSQRHSREDYSVTKYSPK